MINIMKKLADKISIEHASFKYRLSSKAKDKYRIQVVGKLAYWYEPDFSDT